MDGADMLTRKIRNGLRLTGDGIVLDQALAATDPQAAGSHPANALIDELPLRQASQVIGRSASETVRIPAPKRMFRQTIQRPALIFRDSR